MTFAAFSSAAFTSASGVAVAAGAAIEVRRESDSGLAVIYEDRAGASQITQPGFVADASGRFSFFAAGLAGGYSVEVTSGAESFTLRNVAIGLAAELDASTYGGSLMNAATAAAARATLGVQTATTSAEGLVELATQPEMDAGTAGKVPTTDLNKITLDATQATTSGTSKDFSGLPTGIRELKVAIAGFSTSGTSCPIIQLGEVGAGLKVSGYLGSGAYIDNTPVSVIENHDTGFRVGVNHTATVVIHGIATFMHMTGNVWAYSFIGGRSDATSIVKAGGSVTLAGVLDRVRLTTINGTDTFDAGSVNIAYER